MVSEHWFFDTPLVRSACRITLPTDESSVKTILLKMRWIDLISSSFTPYLYSTSPLTLSCFDSALSLFKFRFLVGGIQLYLYTTPKTLIADLG